jgi:hypothetical protein
MAVVIQNGFVFGKGMEKLGCRVALQQKVLGNEWHCECRNFTWPQLSGWPHGPKRLVLGLLLAFILPFLGKTLQLDPSKALKSID